MQSLFLQTRPRKVAFERRKVSRSLLEKELCLWRALSAMGVSKSLLTKVYLWRALTERALHMGTWRVMHMGKWNIALRVEGSFPLSWFSCSALRSALDVFSNAYGNMEYSSTCGGLFPIILGFIFSVRHIQ